MFCLSQEIYDVSSDVWMHIPTTGFHAHLFVNNGQDKDGYLYVSDDHFSPKQGQ